MVRQRTALGAARAVPASMPRVGRCTGGARVAHEYTLLIKLAKASSGQSAAAPFGRRIAWTGRLRTCNIIYYKWTTCQVQMPAVGPLSLGACERVGFGPLGIAELARDWGLPAISPEVRRLLVATWKYCHSSITEAGTSHSKYSLIGSMPIRTTSPSRRRMVQSMEPARGYWSSALKYSALTIGTFSSNDQTRP